MNYLLLGSLRFDRNLRDAEWNSAANGGDPSPYLLLPYVADRFISAIKAHNWPELQLHQLHNLCEKAVQGIDVPRKIRITISQEGDIEIGVSPVPRIPNSLVLAATINPITGDPQPTVSVHLDTQQTPSSIFTSSKTTNRGHYDAARARVNISPVGIPQPIPADVLLYNSHNQLTETSIRNVAFFRLDRWITPSLETGCLSGIMRRSLLEQGLVVEGNLDKEDVQLGEIVLLFNGVEGCSLGRIT